VGELGAPLPGCESLAGPAGTFVYLPLSLRPAPPRSFQLPAGSDVNGTRASVTWSPGWTSTGVSWPEASVSTAPVPHTVSACCQGELTRALRGHGCAAPSPNVSDAICASGCGNEFQR